MQYLTQPWPWYIAGPLIGFTVPLLLLLGNKTFGVSSSFRHVCAACIPSGIPFFSYDWKKESWNLLFSAGIILGAVFVLFFLRDTDPVAINPALSNELTEYGIHDRTGLVPADLVNWSSLFTLKGLLLIVGGGFLVGFGTRYAGGCTSGHSIMGMSNLQWPSLVATICFLAGGFFIANLVLPLILKL